MKNKEKYILSKNAYQSQNQLPPFVMLVHKNTKMMFISEKSVL